MRKLFDKNKKNIEHLICMSFEMILSIIEENDKPMFLFSFFCLTVCFESHELKQTNATDVQFK